MVEQQFRTENASLSGYYDYSGLLNSAIIIIGTIVWSVSMWPIIKGCWRPAHEVELEKLASSILYEYRSLLRLIMIESSGHSELKIRLFIVVTVFKNPTDVEKSTRVPKHDSEPIEANLTRSCDFGYDVDFVLSQYLALE